MYCFSSGTISFVGFVPIDAHVSNSSFDGIRFPGFEAIPKKALAVWTGSVVARIFPRNFMFFLDQSR